MTWTIDKQFDFCYGHRVWSQKLNADYCESGDASCKCRHPHGHQGHVHIFLEGDTLERGMVTDFKHLGWMKNFLDDHLDHKFILDRNDPHFEKIADGKLKTVEWAEETSPGYTEIKDREAVMTDSGKTLLLEPVYIPGTDTIVGHTLNISALEGPEQEWYEGLFIVDFLPTSENLSAYLYNIASEKMSKIGVKVTRVDWFETPKSRSSYTG